MQIVTVTDEKCGQRRLFSEETWPGKSKVERQLLASEVVDSFHRKVRDGELDVQWIPRSGSFVVRSGWVPSVAELERWVEEAYKGE